MLNFLARATLTLCIASPAITAHAETSVSIEGAWIRSAPPSANVMAAYMNIINHSHDNITLKSVSSPQFKNAEIHRTTLHDGMMHMEKVEPFTIPANQEVVFKPGGFHVMLINPHHPLNRGDSATLMLNFDNGDHVMLDIPVQDAADSDDEMPMHHGEGHHH